MQSPSLRLYIVGSFFPCFPIKTTCIDLYQSPCFHCVNNYFHSRHLSLKECPIISVPTHSQLLEQGMVHGLYWVIQWMNEHALIGWTTHQCTYYLVGQLYILVFPRQVWFIPIFQEKRIPFTLKNVPVWIINYMLTLSSITHAHCPVCPELGDLIFQFLNNFSN